MKEVQKETEKEEILDELAAQDTLNQAQKQKYNDYVKKVTPTHNLLLEMLKAFITGGIICCIGQAILNIASAQGLDKQTAGSWCSLLLVLSSVILTGLNIFPSIVKWGGAGALVPPGAVCAGGTAARPFCAARCRGLLSAGGQRYGGGGGSAG